MRTVAILLLTTAAAFAQDVPPAPPTISTQATPMEQALSQKLLRELNEELMCQQNGIAATKAYNDAMAKISSLEQQLAKLQKQPTAPSQ
jgi:hypothetical protein